LIAPLNDQLIFDDLHKSTPISTSSDLISTLIPLIKPCHHMRIERKRLITLGILLHMMQCAFRKFTLFHSA